SPADKRIDQVFYRLGQIDYRNQSFKTALRYFHFILTKYPNTFLLAEIRFDMAECYFKLGNYHEAEELFQESSKTNTDVKKRWESILYLGLIDDSRLEYESAIAKFKRIYTDSAFDDLKSRAVQAAGKIINEKLPKTLVLSLLQKHRTEFPSDLLFLKAMMMARLEADREGYQTYVEEFLRRFPKHPQRADLEKKMALVKGTKPKVLRVGAILPLTGKYALTGQQVLQGIQLAWNQLNTTERESLELVVKDAGDLPLVSPLVEPLADDPSVVAILGPLFSGNVKEVVPVIEKYQVPIFTPTASTADLTQLSPYIFRNTMTRENQGKFMAKHAVNKLQLRNFAILYSNDPYGSELKDAFSREVQALGGKIVAAVSYDREQNDFKAQILQIGGMSDNSLRKYADNKIAPDREGGHLSKPVVEREVVGDGQEETLRISLELGYDAIFIPGSYSKVGLILPQLVYYNIDKVPVLGSNGWNSPALIKVGGKYLKRAVFADGFSPSAHENGVPEFVGSFKSTFGDEPTLFSAQAYDAARIIIELIRKGAKNRVQIKTQLRTIKDFPGVSGKTTILPSGDVEKTLFLLNVKGEKIVSVND
ncbi:MAG: hypothetical protein A3K09_02445, partial [Nitrospinae bacterium RIFCSPLOWO2_12_FULL_47_7]